MKRKTARRFLARKAWKLAEGSNSKIARRGEEARRVLRKEFNYVFSAAEKRDSR